MFEALSAMKGQAIVERTYEGYTYVHTSIIQMYTSLLTIAFVPMFLFEAVLLYVYLEKYEVSFMKATYVSFLANLTSIISALFLFLVEGLMNDLHFSSVFTAAYLVIISFILTFVVESAVIYRFIREEVKKEAMNKAAIISFCANLASHIGLLVFLSFL
jgi:hypothetical protein